MEAYKRSKATSRKRKPAKLPDSERGSLTPIKAGSPQVVGFTVEDSAVGEESGVRPNDLMEREDGGSKGQGGGGEGVTEIGVEGL